MQEVRSDALAELSAALAARVAEGAGSVVALGSEQRFRTGLLWRNDVVVASEQSLPRRTVFEAKLPGGRMARASVAGRDRGTNIVALRLDQPGESPEPKSAEAPPVGSLVVAIGTGDDGSVSARLGLLRRVGPGWHSQAGGRIDRLISLDMALSAREEGGPVLDAAGALLGMSTLGPRGSVLVIPCATIARVLEPLLGAGRVQRGWLGVGVQPVSLPEDQRSALGRDAGLMVVSLVAGAPAAAAGVMQGDILLDMDGIPVTQLHALRAVLDEGRIDRAVAIRLVRAGTAQTVSVTVAARPAE